MTRPMSLFIASLALLSGSVVPALAADERILPPSNGKTPKPKPFG